MTTNPVENFKQLGLIVGSFTLWDERCGNIRANQEEDNKSQQAQRLEKLLWWTLSFPPVDGHKPRLGVNAWGLAIIYYTLLQHQEALNDDLIADEQRLPEILGRLKIPSINSILEHIKRPQNDDKYYDYHHFMQEDGIYRLAKYFKQFAEYVENLSTGEEPARLHFGQTPRRMLIWLERDENDDDIKWWITAMRSTIEDLIRNEHFDLQDITKFGERLECSIFVSIDIPTLKRIDTNLSDQHVKRNIDQAYSEIDKAASRVNWDSSRHLYLSWDLCALDCWLSSEHIQLLHRTMLTLWTQWPRDKSWAPPLETYPVAEPEYPLETAIRLLTDLLPSLRRYFLQIKEAFCLPLSRVEISGKTHYPPTFYFVAPNHRPGGIDACTRNQNIRSLLSNCLGYDDPRSDSLSWSTLEGSLATIRGEVVQEKHYKPRYLFIPVQANDTEIGSDLDYIIDALSLREYTIAIEAKDLSDHINDILKKRAADVDTANILDSFMLKLARLVPTLPHEILGKCSEEFMRLQLSLGRVHYMLEKMKGEAAQLQQSYESFLYNTEEYLRREVIMAPLPNFPQLSSALKDSYPYRLKETMKNLINYAIRLESSSTRIGSLLELLSTAVLETDREQRENSANRLTIIGAAVAVITLLVGVIALLGTIWTFAESIFKLWPNKGDILYGQITLIVCVIMAVGGAGFYVWKRRQINKFGLQIWKLLPFHSDPNARQKDDSFQKSVRKFWHLADDITTQYATEMGRTKNLPALDPLPSPEFKSLWNDDRGADAIDTRATEKLKGLWEHFESPCNDSDNPELSDITTQVRMLLHFLQLFVLRPERIPLPRTLCIFRYKSLQLLGKRPTISDNEFCDSLLCTRPYSQKRIEQLQNWLSLPENQTWVRRANASTEEIIARLKEAGVCTGFTKRRIEQLQNWLSLPENQTWMINTSFDEIVKRLEERHVSIKFIDEQKEQIRRWLSQPENQKWISQKELSAAQVTEKLKTDGIPMIEELWRGSLDSPCYIAYRS